MPYTLDDRQRRDLWGLALAALALLSLLSMVPLSLLGSTGLRWFPTGNIVGVAGRESARAAWWLLGGGAILLPVFPSLWGAVAFGRVSAGIALRWTALLVGSIVLLPGFATTLGASTGMAGWVGGGLSTALVGVFGWTGAALLLWFGFTGLCVATVRWNPVRAAWGLSRRAAGATRPRVGVPVTAAVAAPKAKEVVAELWDANCDTDPFPEAAPAPEAPPARKPAKVKRLPEAQPELVAVEMEAPAAADLPPTTLLTPAEPRDEAAGRAELGQLGKVLIDKLATFRIAGEIVGTTTGPVVTQFEVEPAPGVKVSRIASLEDDLALAMRAASVRIVAPIPGKGAVGVEVPNPTPEMVRFREVLESPQFRASKAELPLALGKDIAGRPYVADLAKMPHLLIAGATGSGKSVCVNTLITSLVYRHPPQRLRFLMIDPKMVELSMYKDLPHLRHPVVTDNNDAAAVLRWAVIEMERRYKLLSANGVRNLQDFNRRLEGGQMMRAVEAAGPEGDPDRWIYQGGTLPYIVVIIDEMADLMMTVQGEVEKPIAMLAQKARAIGIHLVLATQRPTVNVITGLIKANFPSRIAFRVSSKIDSRTILDQNGANALLGNGDMLLMPPAANDPVRIQGAYLSTEETEELMRWYRERNEERQAEEDILETVRALEDAGPGEQEEEAMGERDRLFREAAELCIQHQGGSTSLLQRRLRIGYGRAARIVDQLHHAGVLGPPDGSKPREVLVDLLSLDAVCPDRSRNDAGVVG